MKRDLKMQLSDIVFFGNSKSDNHHFGQLQFFRVLTTLRRQLSLYSRIPNILHLTLKIIVM